MTFITGCGAPIVDESLDKELEESDDKEPEDRKGWLASWTEDEDFKKKEEIKILVMVTSINEILETNNEENAPKRIILSRAARAAPKNIISSTSGNHVEESYQYNAEDDESSEDEEDDRHFKTRPSRYVAVEEERHFSRGSKGREKGSHGSHSHKRRVFILMFETSCHVKSYYLLELISFTMHRPMPYF
uniref:Uncharacterized protein n=1 Tax=Daucus carota subsp. sativus TaxID=79200 RepID=A0A169WJ72_DAUCS